MIEQADYENCADHVKCCPGHCKDVKNCTDLQEAELILSINFCLYGDVGCNVCCRMLNITICCWRTLRTLPLRWSTSHFKFLTIRCLLRCIRC